MTILDQPQFSAYSGSPILFLVEQASGSPYKAVADIYIWFGSKPSKPGTRNYRLTKVLDVNNKAIFNISDFVKDFLTNENPETYDGAAFQPNVNEAAWVQVNFGYINDSNVLFPDLETSNIFISTRGYGSFLQGKNPQLPALLTSVKTQKVDVNNNFVIGINNAENIPLNKLIFRPDVGADIPFEASLNKDESDKAIVYFDVSPVVFTGLYKYSYEIIIAEEDDTPLGSMTVEVTDKCKYASYTLQYVNKYGVWDAIPYNLKSVLSSNVERSDFQNTDLGISESTTTLTYDTSKPQFRKYNINTIRGIELNTDLLDESINEAVEEMLSSDYCYLKEFASAVNPSVSSFSRQEFVNRDLVQFTHNFEFAYNEQNKVL